MIEPTLETRAAAAIKLREEQHQNRVGLIEERMEIPSRYGDFRVADFAGADYERVRYWAGATLPDAYTSEDQVYKDWQQYRKQGLYLYGAYGCGKTAIASALLHERAIHDYQGGLFVTTTDLLDRIRRSFDDKEPDDVLKKAQDAWVLVLDDIGAEKVTDWVLDRFFALINHRYNALFTETIFTSNKSPDELAKHVGERIAWRVMEMCRVIQLKGPNRRSTSA